MSAVDTCEVQTDGAGLSLSMSMYERSAQGLHERSVQGLHERSVQGLHERSVQGVRLERGKPRFCSQVESYQ